MKKFIDLDDLDDFELARVIATAKDLEKRPVRKDLAGKTAGLLFMNPSLRTLASMQAGMSQLGGASFVITPGAGTWLLETKPGVVMDGDKAEHVREAIPVLAQYADVIGVRCFAAGKDLAEDQSDAVIRAMAEVCPKPFINLESAIRHPCQALADWKTLDDIGVPASPEGKVVLSWVYHPRGLPFAVAASALEMAARRGNHVTVLRPEGYSLPKETMARAHALAKKSGGAVHETDDRRAAMKGAHVLYAKAWGSVECYGRPEEEAKKRADLKSWCVDEPWFDGALSTAKFMHCLPVRRNVKVTDRVLDGARSVVIKQAGNRLHAQKALLLEVLSQKEC